MYSLQCEYQVKLRFSIATIVQILQGISAYMRKNKDIENARIWLKYLEYNYKKKLMEKNPPNVPPKK
ncbi:hypothetical protein BLOT_010110 [Blomia tropicalis]|nr:hypothetical protein BLOT_010110 [Blomia tropicalis]